MIKMRLQGSRNEICWFLKVLEKDPRFDVEDTSLAQADVEKMQIKKKAKKSLKRKSKKKRR